MNTGSAIEIARKQRHLHLLGKIKSSQPLSAAELKELEKYENEITRNAIKPADEPPAKVRKKTTTKKKKSSKKPASKKATKKKVAKKKSAKKKRIRLPISAARVRVLAMEFETLAEADASIAESINLVEVIGLHKQLVAAWGRGRFLRNIAIQAASPMTAQEAAYAMSMAPEQLAEILANDIEAADLWDQGSIGASVSIKMKMVAQADAGNRTAIAAVSKMLADVRRPEMDFNKVSESQMVVLFGVSRVTLHKWRTTKGAPRNDRDHTWSLPAMISWYAGFSASKGSPASAMPAERPGSVQALKAERMKRELEAERGQLLDRGEVVAGIIARLQVIVNAAANIPDQLAGELEGADADTIAASLRKMFDGIMKALQSTPQELKMSEKAEKYFVKCLKELEAA